MPILSRTVLCGAIVACLSSAATVEAFVQLPRRGVDAYDGYHHRHSSVVMVGVLLVLIVFTAIFIIYWHRTRRIEEPAPRHAWQDLEKQKAMHQEVFQTVELSKPAPVGKQKGLHNEVFQNVELNERAPVGKQKALHNEVFQNVELNERAPVEKQKALHNEAFENVKLSEPAPVVVHSPKKKRATDTWDKYLSMIKSPSRLNSIVGKMSTMK